MPRYENPSLDELLAFRRLDAAVRNFDNGWLNPFDAQGAILDKRPAFWSLSDDTDMMLYAHKLNTNRQLTSFSEYPTVEVLDTLIPLNKAAVAELIDAYSARGTSRDLDQLDTRHSTEEPE